MIQQTVLKVKTNRPSTLTITGTTSMTISGSTTGFTYSGTGVSGDPYTGTYPIVSSSLIFNITGDGTFNFDLLFDNVSIGSNYIAIYIQHSDENFSRKVLQSYSPVRYIDYFKVRNGDTVTIKQGGTTISPTSTFSVYLTPDIDYQQYTVDEFEVLDLYDDIPIKVSKSYAELQDIGKKNSDYSIGLSLPGSKKNNSFFENFFNVDNTSLYFDVTKKVECSVLKDDQLYFSGYLRLNKINVQNSEIEYDVSLFSTVGDLFGAIGNNLLKDLNFRDADYFFNHIFNQNNVIQDWRYETLRSTNIVPSNYFYPVSHNGYNYENKNGQTLVKTTGTTGVGIYTTTKLGSWVDNATAYSNGVERYHINSPEDGIRVTQLKPALNVWSLVNLIFKSYGYKIKSDFMTTPWIKLLYTYQFYSNNSTTLTYTAPPLSTFGLSGVDLVYTQTNFVTIVLYVVKAGTGTPCLCDTAITGTINKYNVLGQLLPQNFTIPPNTASITVTFTPFGVYFLGNITSSVGVSNRPLNYLPSQTGTTVTILDNEYLDMSQLIDENIKQIDFLSSVAKKFNLVFVPNVENPNEIIVEPYQYYVGTGQIYDWTDKLSWDKGFSVEPAQNFVESELELTDKIGEDSANDEFRKTNNRIYGRNIVYNPTDFKSSNKKIETIFSPQLLRKWNPSNLTGVTNDVGMPLMINYSETSQENDKKVDWTYSGVKSNPRLIFNLGNFSPFLDSYEEIFTLTGATTSYFRITSADGLIPQGSLINPMVSHTMPIGNPDVNKINNDSITILYNGESKVDLFAKSTEIVGSGSTFNIFTEQNVYNLFYYNRVQNSFNKNTRFLSGYFDLKLSDIENLEAKDLIKINDQYFSWNKIDGFNLTNPELTKVELIQTNYQVSQYPDRYFKYQYCSGDTTTYKFKTNFAGSNSIYDSLFYWSIVYDYFVGTLGGGGVTGFTSSFLTTGNTYCPYSMWEVSESDYSASGTTFTFDPLVYQFILKSEESPSSTIYNQNNPIWLINSNQSKGTLNLFTGCTDFNTTATSMGVLVNGSPTGSTFTSGATINVTDTGWIKYTTSSGLTFQYISSTGSQTLTACLECGTIQPGFPYSDLASFTITNCGNSC